MGFLDQLISIDELATKLGVNPKTVRRWMDRAELLGLDDAFYQVEPWGRITVHEPTFEKWYKGRLKTRLGERGRAA